LREIQKDEIINEIKNRIEVIDIPRAADLLKLLECRRQIILAGPPGTSKTYNALKMTSLLGGDNSKGNGEIWNELDQNQNRQFESNQMDFSGIKVVWDIVQFHPSYSYEDFVSGIEANSENGTLSFDRKRRIFLQMVDVARKNPEIKCVLIIDEINRGILGRIFGELIMTLEYRDLAVRLSGQDERISIPNNMYLIGTMNTADRNISLVDHALRRRFLIVECLPDKTLLEEYLKSHFGSNIQSVSIISNIFEAVQEAFYRDGLKEYERDSRGYSLGDYAIGHTYFMVQNLESLWINLRYQIIPLMEEYRKEGILTDELLKRTADHIRRLNLNLNQNDANAKWLENWCLTIIGQQ
jgi:MoxR-like ATPase